GYAEYAVVHATNALPVPPGLDMTAAGAMPETFFTVWHNLFERGRLAAGEAVLIHGGSSGIGTTALQLARAFGAHPIFATAGSPEKCRACESLGASRAIDYKHEDFVKLVKESTGGRGVDVILDMVGGAYVQRDLSALAPDGRLVFIAFLGGASANVNFMPILLKRIVLTGSTLRARTVEAKGAIAASLARTVWPLLEAGTVKPVIHCTFPLAEAAAAHRLMESSAHIGKIVLAV
ncbi:MAG: NAD(P)H-quinone oxidoreductase, partial [Stellaceae bacterium]